MRRLFDFAIRSPILCIAAVYLLMASGYIDSIDATPSIETADALLSRGTLAIEPTSFMPTHYSRRSDGAIFSRMGFGTALLYLPAVAATKLTRSIVEDLPQEPVVAYFASFVSTFLAIGTLAALRIALRNVGVNERDSAKIVLAAAFATLIFAYSKSQTRDIALAFAAMGFTAAEMVAARTRRWNHRALAVLFVALGLSIKQSYGVMLAPLWVYFRLQEIKCRDWTAVMSATIPAMAGVFAVLLLQTHAFEAWYNTGYGSRVMSISGGAWSTPFWQGVYQQLLDPNGGLLFFSPLSALLLVGFVARTAVGRLRVSGLDLAVIASLALMTAFHARWFSPVGVGPCGPRYLVPTIAPLFLLLRRWPRIELRDRWRPFWRVGFGGALAASVAVQLCLVLTKPTHIQNISQAAPPSMPRVTSIEANFRVLAHKLTSKNETYCFRDFASASVDPSPSGGVDLSGVRTLRGFNIWWLHTARLIADKRATKKALDGTPSAPSCS